MPTRRTRAWRRRWRPARSAADEEPRVVRDDPGHAEALEPRDARRIVDRPDVELAAGRLYCTGYPAVDHGEVGHHGIDLARQELGLDATGEPPPVLVGAEQRKRAGERAR